MRTFPVRIDHKGKSRSFQRLHLLQIAADVHQRAEYRVIYKITYIILRKTLSASPLIGSLIRPEIIFMMSGSLCMQYMRSKLDKLFIRAVAVHEKHYITVS